jgi:hypothetical protein
MNLRFLFKVVLFDFGVFLSCSELVDINAAKVQRTQLLVIFLQL